MKDLSQAAKELGRRGGNASKKVTNYKELAKLATEARLRKMRERKALAEKVEA